MPQWTCPECHKEIPSGEQPCHCAGCHETFIGLIAFDHHRNRFKCLNPNSVLPNKNGDTFSIDHLGNWHWGEERTPDEWERISNERIEKARERLIEHRGFTPLTDEQMSTEQQRYAGLLERLRLA